MRRDIRTFLSLRVAGYLAYILPTVRTVKNWSSLLSDYVGITNKGRVYTLRNGLKIETKDGISSGTIVVVFVKKDYGEAPPPNSTVIDIGANIGVYSLYATQSQGTRVYAFEPMPQNFTLLKKNIEQNNLAFRIFPFQLAISGRRETRTLYLGTSPMHSFLPISQSPFNARFSSKENQPAQESAQVSCIPLQDVFDENRIMKCDLLKLDCEGAEYDILYNLPGAYFQRIQRIRMEYHNHLDKKENTGDALEAFLRGKGFQLEKRKRGSLHQGDIWLKR